MLPPLIELEHQKLREEAARLKPVQIGNPDARKRLKDIRTRQLQIEVRG